MKRSIVSPGFVKRTLAKLLKMDQQLGIVVDGNVASQAIAVGKYVNLINSTITGKPDGIYVATGAVSSGGTVTAADISGDAVADGVTNDLSEQIGTLLTTISGSTYLMLYDGTLIQWGSETSVTSGNRTKYFSKNFKDTNYAIIANDNSGNDNYIACGSLAKGQFTIYHSGSAKVSWIAIGRWK